MKKILFAALALACFGFTACSDDDDESVYIYSNAAEEVIGTYEGTWYRILTDTVVAEHCSIAVAAHVSEEGVSTNYLVDVTVPKTTAVSLDSMTSVANVAQQGKYGFIISNVSSENGFATSFRAYVNFDDQYQPSDITLNFVKTVKNGRKSYDYTYKFVGSKKAEAEE